jgi:hypothetical protein
LLAERFLRSANGLVIILGLAGAFYGNTMAIGRLVELVAGDGAAVADLTQTLTHGLTQALAGMSVAFSTSLFGVGSAIVLTVVGVFANLSDRRLRVMIALETYLDNVLLRSGEASAPSGHRGAIADGQGLGLAVESFERSVARLENAIASFDGALQNFAGTTRDFREFNLHLKDNVQRMSLSFGDMSEAVKTHVAVLVDQGRRR